MIKLYVEPDRLSDLEVQFHLVTPDDKLIVAGYTREFIDPWISKYNLGYMKLEDRRTDLEHLGDFEDMEEMYKYMKMYAILGGFTFDADT